MKKRLCASGSLLLILLMLVQLLSFPTAAQEDSAQALSVPNYYGREALSSLPNATALLFAYDQITQGVESSTATISVYNGTDPISQTELATVFDAYRRDHAEHFWLSSSYTFSYTSQTVLSVTLSYLFTGEELASAKLSFEAAAKGYLSLLSPSMSDFEKELTLHDALAAGVVYDLTAPNAHNAYGALVEGRAVCEGYAEALQCLLRLAGIRSFLVYGNSKGEAHAWNLVEIDGQFYHVDLTWNDQEGYLFHAYFNLSDEAILEDHEIDSTAYALPTASATDAHYFAVKGGLLESASYSADEIGTRLSANALTASFFVTQSTDAFLDWYQGNVRDVAQAAGVTGQFSYGSMQLGREIVIYMEACKHTAMTYVPAVPLSCTQNGSIAYYECSCGKLFSDAEATQEILNEYETVLLSPGHQWTERIEDDAHKRSTASSCLSHDTYWFDCSECDAISTTAYFEGTAIGPHEPENTWQSDGNGHWRLCRYCLVYRFDEDAHLYDHDCDAACNVCGTSREVTHDYSDQWSHDGQAHWKACTCSEKTAYGTHVDANGDRLCDVCGYALPAQTTAPPASSSVPTQASPLNTSSASTELQSGSGSSSRAPVGAGNANGTLSMDQLLTYVGIGIGVLFVLIVLVNILKRLRSH